MIYCYKSGSDWSFKNIKAYKQILDARWPNVPVLIVSCCSEPVNFRNITLAQKIRLDQTLCDRINAFQHVYCSALNRFNVEKVFVNAFKCAIENCLRLNQNKREDELIDHYKLADVFQPRCSTQNQIILKDQSSLNKTIPSNDNLSNSWFKVGCLTVLMIYLIVALMEFNNEGFNARRGLKLLENENHYLTQVYEYSLANFNSTNLFRFVNLTD